MRDGDEPMHTTTHITRRRFLIGAAGAGLVTLLPDMPARATPASMRAAIKAVVGDATVNKGRIRIDLPPLVENGNAVALSLSVESPMTEADHVKAIHVFTEKNPQPYVVTFRLGPRAGKAHIRTRMRLADTQTVLAIAEMSDGSFFSDEADVVVTLAACLEEG
jgi:sulfur-oxidizing protein SoxY